MKKTIEQLIRERHLARKRRNIKKVMDLTPPAPTEADIMEELKLITNIRKG